MAGGVGPPEPLITLGFRLVAPIVDALAGPLLRRFSLSGEPVEPTDGNVFDPDACLDLTTPRPERIG